MPTKAGEYKLCDVRQGKTGWAVLVLTENGQLYTRAPQRMEFITRPWVDLRGTVRLSLYADTLEGGGRARRHTSAFVFGMSAQLSHRLQAGRFRPSPGNSRIFTTRQAALRYIARINAQVLSSEDYSNLFEKLNAAAMLRLREKFMKNSRFGAAPSV